MGYSLGELSASTMKDIFDAAFIDCHLDSDGDLVVDDGLKVFIKAEPQQKLLKIFALTAPSADRAGLLEFCNRFNDRLIMARASVADNRTSDGDCVLTFDHDHFVLEDETIEPKKLVWLVRRFTKIVRDGVAREDVDDLFD